MIKEKPEKNSDTTKDEAGSSDKETASTEVRVKKEDETTVKKEPCTGPITKNGGIVGSTNTGSLQTTLDRKPDVHSEDSLSVSATDSSSLPLKQEECIDGELGGDAFGLGLPTTGGSSHSQPPEGVQPLASNVITKQPNSMEVNYMQQQSQIFVFSTMLANSGADEVLQGRYPSIIAYHCAQPGTKKYLEKNPLKVTQFNRQNPAQWLSNIAMMKNKSCNRSPGLGPKPPTTLDNFLGPDPLDDMVGLDEANIPWDTKNNHLEGLDAAVSNGLPDVVPDMDACSPSLSNVQPSLQGVKVPDENLTPQQRQHREVQLATIRKMQQMLFPESQSIDGVPSGGGNGPGTGNNGLPDPSVSSGTVPTGGGQLEWQKLHQFYDDPKRKQGPGPVVPVGPVSGGSTGLNMPVGSGGQPVMTRGIPGPGPRLQGPPPPYHQTPRSASVPIALQSPNPTSPNNPTSNLSLPSPRASSALNSPADPNRPFGLSRHMSTGQSPTSQDSPSAPRLNHSNPSTPLSSHHLSPSVTSSSTEPTSTHQSTVDGMFGRTLQSIAQQKQQISTSTSSCATTPTTGVKEPNLMPVPSPQQIQYLNTFEGQELIIQKQPNTSLKEGNIISPPILPTTMESGFPVTTSDLPHSRVSGPNTPTSIDVGPRFPPTPSEGCRFQIPSPHTPTAVTAGEKPSQRLSGLSPQTVPGPNSDPLKTDLFPTPSPHMMDVPRFPGPNASPGAKMGGGFVNLSPQAKPLDIPNYGCVRGDNVPLNPNCTSTMSGNPKVSHFDPISSLAQMSQQLTNSVASSLNGQSNQGPPMMNFGSPSMHMMDMGGCHQKFEPTWDSLDSRKLPQWYDDAKIGIFVHWGVYSVPSIWSEWFWIDWKEGNKEINDFMQKNYRPNFTYQEFSKELTGEFFNVTQWAELFRKSGAKYVVLTSKHHEGYAMWPSKYSFSWNSVDTGPGRDVIGELSEAVRRQNLTFGLYHSLFEWFNPMYLSDKNSNWTTKTFVYNKILPEMHELIENYRPAVLWSDGEWEAPYQYWNATYFLAWLFNESPVKDYIVTNDRWGMGTLCEHGDFYTCKDRYNPGSLQPHKWENAMTIDKRSWGYRRNMDLFEIYTIEELLEELAITVSCGGNLLMNIGPTKEGTIIPIFQERLLQMGQWLSINGEGIYETKPWVVQNDTLSEGVWYTSKEAVVYGIVLNWPENDTLSLGSVKSLFENCDAKVILLGNEEDGNLQWTENNDVIKIKFPTLSKVKSKWAYVLKIRQGSKNPGKN